MTLKKYQQKRSFSHTSEPKAKKQSLSSKLPVFCVQMHDASHLHYDFRLEHKGVLLSWAIPKGPSINSSEKRLAIHVEDHPLEYRHFEGIISEGNYGAGTVMIWDEGPYATINGKTKKEIANEIDFGLKKGHLEFILDGEKLKGAFSLVKMKDNQWLLIKGKDRYAKKGNIQSLNHSVRTDRTLEDISGGISFKKRKTKRKKLPGFFTPMLATLIQSPFDDAEWIFETKWDGYRALAFIEDQVTLYSRNQTRFNPLFPSIVKELSHVKTSCILDGELVILDSKGKSDFQLMQTYQKTKKGNLFYYVFDLLFWDGQDIRQLPLMERREKLQAFLNAHHFHQVRYSEHFEKKGIALFKQAQKHDLEGIIAKRKTSIYASVRSKEWLKIKTKHRQEAVIIGFTKPRASRKYFGSLLLGVYEKKQLRFIGHVGTGFTSKTLKDLYEKMEPLIVEASPLREKIKTNTPAIWIKPKLVCEVTFAEWTDDNIMRQPSFQGLRIDKKAQDVIREKPV